MLLDEHTSKALFHEAGLTVPDGIAILPGEEMTAIPSSAGPWYAKAQVLTGGRGKAGGILRVETLAELPGICRTLFATPIHGSLPPYLRLEPATAFHGEYYLSFAVARSRERIVFTVSPAGGMDVEDQADEGTAPLIQELDPLAGLSDHQIRAAFFHLAARGTLGKSHLAPFAQLVRRLETAVTRYGMLLAEINPLVLDDSGDWTALDGKVELDDAAVGRDPSFERFYVPGHHLEIENRARAAGVSYQKLARPEDDTTPQVGYLANGAGLAMATMDALNFAGLPPANFMDLGGAADETRMAQALSLLFEDADVGVVFLNLFGGIVSCKTVATALTGALGGKPPVKPIVARMDGTDADEARAILEALACDNLHVRSFMQEALELLKRLMGNAPQGLSPSAAKLQDSSIRFEELRARRARSAKTGPLPILAPSTHPLLTLSAASPVLVQGITGKAASLHVARMQAYGTNIVAGVTPFKGGTSHLGVPVYNSVREALAVHDVAASIVFVPAPFAADAVLEAAENEIPLCVCITEHIPQQEMLAVRRRLADSKTSLVGPNTPGVIVPGATKIGIMPESCFTPLEDKPGVAIFSRSGTLTYEAAARLSAAGIGQSLCVGMGGDPFVGQGFTELAKAVANDPRTAAVLVIGEIGGDAEERLAAYVRERGYRKPLLAFVAGRTAPPGKRLGHAGAILEEGGETIDDKLATLARAGFHICPSLDTIDTVVGRVLG